MLILVDIFHGIVGHYCWLYVFGTWLSGPPRDYLYLISVICYYQADLFDNWYQDQLHVRNFQRYRNVNTGCRTCLVLMAMRIELVLVRRCGIGNSYHAVIKLFLKLSPRIKCPWTLKAMGTCQGVVQNSFFSPDYSEFYLGGHSAKLKHCFIFINRHNCFFALFWFFFHYSKKFQLCRILF